MKKRRKEQEPQFDELIPSLLAIWRRFNKIYGGPPDRLQTREFRGVVESVLRLEERFSSQPHYFKERPLLGAYLFYHWPLHYAQALSLLSELPNVPHRVLDLCSGPAPIAFAALQHGASEVMALDESIEALKLGAEVCGRSGYTLSIREWQAFHQPIPEGPFDLISLGYGLFELFPDRQAGWFEKACTFVTSLLEKLSPQGALLLIESSHTPINHKLLKLRNRLVEQGIPIQAPCVWRGSCPALETATPCYAQRPMQKPYLISEIQRSANINLSSLKMSYLLLRHPQAGWPKLPPTCLGRVISPPIETPQGRSFYLCSTEGKKKLSSRFEHHPQESRAFDFLQRGDLVAIEGLEQASNLQLNPATKLSIYAACGKPVPETV